MLQLVFLLHTQRSHLSESVVSSNAATRVFLLHTQRSHLSESVVSSSVQMLQLVFLLHAEISSVVISSHSLLNRDLICRSPTIGGCTGTAPVRRQFADFAWLLQRLRGRYACPAMRCRTPTINISCGISFLRKHAREQRNIKGRKPMVRTFRFPQIPGGSVEAERTEPPVRATGWEKRQQGGGGGACRPHALSLHGVASPQGAAPRRGDV